MVIKRSAAPGRRDQAEESEDAALVRSAVAQYEAPLTLYAARLLGPAGDVERAREIVQDTFLKLWTADRASVNGHLAAWLYRVCRNRALDVRRKELRMTTLEKQHIEQCESPADGAQASADPQRVFDALEYLPDKQQEVIRLKFQGGLSYQEIATVMDITANHVGVLIHTAIKTIREKLGVTDGLKSSAGTGTTARTTP